MYVLIYNVVGGMFLSNPYIFCHFIFYPFPTLENIKCQFSVLEKTDDIVCI